MGTSKRGVPFIVKRAVINVTFTKYTPDIWEVPVKDWVYPHKLWPARISGRERPELVRKWIMSSGPHEHTLHSGMSGLELLQGLSDVPFPSYQIQTINLSGPFNEFLNLREGWLALYVYCIYFGCIATTTLNSCIQKVQQYCAIFATIETDTQFIKGVLTQCLLNDSPCTFGTSTQIWLVLRVQKRVDLTDTWCSKFVTVTCRNNQTWY